MGFSVPPRLRLERWALTPPFHPYHALPQTARNFVGPGALTRRIFLAASGRARRYILCGTFRRDASRHRLPRVSPAKPELRGIAPCSVRTFLPPGLRRESDSPPFQNQPKYSSLFDEGKLADQSHDSASETDENAWVPRTADVLDVGLDRSCGY